MQKSRQACGHMNPGLRNNYRFRVVYNLINNSYLQFTVPSQGSLSNVTEPHTGLYIR